MIRNKVPKSARFVDLNLFFKSKKKNITPIKKYVKLSKIGITNVYTHWLNTIYQIITFLWRARAAGTSKTYPIPFSGNSLISGNKLSDDL